MGSKAFGGLNRRLKEKTAESRWFETTGQAPFGRAKAAYWKIKRYFCSGVCGSAPPAPPPPGLCIASGSRCLRLLVSALERFGGRLQGTPGARAVERLAGGEGGWHPGRHRRAGMQEAFAARTSSAGPRWRGLSRTRISLSDSGRVQWEVGRTRAGDAA